MSDDLIDRLTAAFLGHADHVDRNLFGRARDALQAQAAEIERLRADLLDADCTISWFNSGAELQAITAAHNDTLAKLREAVEALKQIEWSNDSKWQSDCARAFLATMEKTDGQ